jgi:hypothetical protein
LRDVPIRDLAAAFIAHRAWHIIMGGIAPTYNAASKDGARGIAAFRKFRDRSLGQGRAAGRHCRLGVG